MTFECTKSSKSPFRLILYPLILADKADSMSISVSPINREEDTSISKSLIDCKSKPGLGFRQIQFSEGRWDNNKNTQFFHHILQF